MTTKFGNFVTPEGGREIRNDAAYIRESVENSLKTLKTDYIDLLYWYVDTTNHSQKLLLTDISHRFNGKVPVEEIVAVMKEFVE